jgi:hypothetical protein
MQRYWHPQICRAAIIFRPGHHRPNSDLIRHRARLCEIGSHPMMSSPTIPDHLGGSFLYIIILVILVILGSDHANRLISMHFLYI